MSLKNRLRREENKKMKHNQAGQMQMRIDLNELQPFICECGSGLFIKGEIIKKVPALLSPNGLPGIAEMQTVKICYACGKIYPLQDILDVLKKEEAIKPVIIAP